MIQICRRCLYSSEHPLNIVFDEDGICSGCRVHEEKDLLDWEERSNKLQSILSIYRNKSGNNYDCVIPVSGARDSYFIVDQIKNKYGMNPLLVTYNKHYNTAIGYRNLANLRIKFDVDLFTLTIKPQTIKKITRSTFRRFGSIYWHCLAGQTVFPVQVAVNFKIPLIIWGAHQGVDQVGMFSHLDEVEMTRKYRKEHDLMGYEAEDLINEFDNLQEEDLKRLFYPSNSEIEKIGVRGIYLNNYIRWDSRLQHRKMVDKYKFETAKQSRTFDTCNDVDCWNYSDVHDFIKYVKHGYGKVLDHVNRDIRLGHLTREQGVMLAKQYIQKEPKHLDLFLNWLQITENSFYFILDQHRNPKYWRRNKNWEWEYYSKLFINSKEECTNEEIFMDEFVTSVTRKSQDNNDEYILIGKGR